MRFAAPGVSFLSSSVFEMSIVLQNVALADTSVQKIGNTTHRNEAPLKVET